MTLKSNGEELLAYIREGHIMTNNEKLRLIVHLSIPSILAQLSSILMFFIDAAMVGQLGAEPAAAIGLVESTIWLFGGLLSALSMGFSVQVAHSIGANDFERARSILRQSLTCALIYSGVMTIAALSVHSVLPYWLGGDEAIASDSGTYFMIFALALPFLQIQGLSASMLKCSGNMKTPSKLSIQMCVLDVVFNYIFIFVCHWGVAGAALGTFVAAATTAVRMTYALLVKSKDLAITTHGGSYRPTAITVVNAFRIGAPMGLQHILMSGAQIVSTLIVAPLGMIAIAANSFGITVESLCYMPGYGVAEAATTLVGQGIGAGQKELTRSFARLSVAIGIVIMTFMGVLMWIFAAELMSLMSPVEAIQSIGARSLRIEAFAEPMFAAAIVCNGVFIGAGDTLKPAIMSLVSMWGIRLTLAALLAGSYGLPGVWTAMAIELTFRGAIFLARLFSGKWERQNPTHRKN